MHAVLSFLGTGKYEKATYRWLDKKFSTRYIAVALQELFSPDRILVVMTEEAADAHGEDLAECIRDFIPIITSAGSTEEELWTIINDIIDNIPAGCSLTVDVTHGFRSQPMLALACCTFLRAVGDTRIERIVYGAYEARDETGVAPVFDLTPFLGLIDWSHAADMLIRYGDARPLHDLVTASVGQDPVRTQARQRAIAAKLRTLTQALALIRPEESVIAAAELSKALSAFHKKGKAPHSLRPFSEILDRSMDRFHNMRLKGSAGIFSREGLRAQAEIIEEYLKTDRYVQAITLARESYLSLYCMENSLDPGKPNDRMKAQAELKQLRSGLPLRAGERKICAEWSSITSIRNDVDHAGMTEDALPAEKAIGKIEQACRMVIDRLRAFNKRTG